MGGYSYNHFLTTYSLSREVSDLELPSNEALGSLFRRDSHSVIVTGFSFEHQVHLGAQKVQIDSIMAQDVYRPYSEKVLSKYRRQK